MQIFGDKKAELIVMHKTTIMDMEAEVELRTAELKTREPGIVKREMALDELLASSMKMHHEAECQP